MKILTGKQIHEVDRATIERECITSLELMERAAEEIARWIAENVGEEHRLIFCCGKGGNGGDGLAVARMLAGVGRECVVCFGAECNEIPSKKYVPIDDNGRNLLRLPREIDVYDIVAEQPEIESDAVVIDALLGTGITGKIREPLRSIIEWMNRLPNRIISIDIPSGMSAEPGGSNGSVVRAETTLTLEFPKLAMLLPETGECAGNIVVLPIGLDENFIAKTSTPYYYMTDEWVENLRLSRAKFSHKGDYGHALLVCGSASMPGAAILATGGALRSGCGFVTAHIPATERFALSANHPSAMLSLDGAECFSQIPDGLERFSAIGVGCGLGQAEKTVDALEQLLTETYKRNIPMVLDADALNMVAENPRLYTLIPPGSVLTPHPGELQRLVGKWDDDSEKLKKTSTLAAETKSIVVVKGAHTVICTPDGRFIFNSTGTPGMAKGGSGDVLAGYITGLTTRGYNAEAASVLGVYIHGRAGERAAEMYGSEAMNSADLAEFLAVEIN
jgi:NAD(P)H-hydrate epimerase